MKKVFALVLTVVLAMGLSMTVFAVDHPYDPEYVPEIPDAIQYLSGNSFPAFPNGFSYTSQDSYNTFYDFMESIFTGEDGKPGLILLSQGAYNKQKEDNGIEYDRQYTVWFLKFSAHKSTAAYEFGSFSHHGGPRHSQVMTTGNTMLFFPLGNEFYFARAQLDIDTNKFVLDTPYSKFTGISIPFTYVLYGSSLSGEHELYPYRDEIGGLRMEIGTDYVQENDSCERDYNWWVGIGGDVPPPVKPYNPDEDLNKDTNGDGKPDINIDFDGDGKADLNVDTDGDGAPDINVDTNGDGKPDINLDTDGDRKPDLNIDADGDKLPDISVDTNGDGKPDINIDTNGDGKPDINVDTNGDKKPDINIDTNGDGKPDINIDTNGDKKPDLNVDTNGDGKPDINIDTTGDGRADTNVDTDGDGVPDYNVKPGGGSSGGSGTPGSWWEEDSGSGDLTYNGWEFFNPFKFSYTPFEWDNDYDPLKGYTAPSMPEIPGATIPEFNGYDPFEILNDTPFRDYVNQFGGR